MAQPPTPKTPLGPIQPSPITSHQSNPSIAASSAGPTSVESSSSSSPTCKVSASPNKLVTSQSTDFQSNSHLVNKITPRSESKPNVKEPASSPAFSTPVHLIKVGGNFYSFYFYFRMISVSYTSFRTSLSEYSNNELLFILKDFSLWDSKV